MPSLPSRSRAPKMAKAPSAAAGGGGISPSIGGVAGKGTNAQQPNGLAQRKRPSKGSSTNHIPGKREMKEYPITEETLDSIAVMKRSSAGCYSAASLFFGLAISSAQSLCFAGKDVSAAMWGAWIAIGIISAIAAFGGVLAARWFDGREKNALQKIKDETTHA
jgi:hypothetical protein